MKNPGFRSRFRRAALVLLSIFVFLFGFRLLYSYTSGGREYESGGSISNFFESNDIVRRNYASEKTNRKSFEKSSEKTGNTSEAPAQTTAAPRPNGGEIKYEKKGDVRSRSRDFENDEKNVRGKLTAFRCIIQHEQNSGRPGDRELYMQIGVPPEQFDSCFLFLKTIGKVQTADVTKTDQTSEFKNLEARRLSLEKTRESLIEFKRQSGRIEEFMNLQNRILEIEEELQSLGVQLGDFASENEFCTVQLSLVEGSGPAPVSLMHRLKVTFEWSITYFCYISLALCFVVICAYVSILLIDKLKPLAERLMKRFGEKKEQE